MHDMSNNINRKDRMKQFYLVCSMLLALASCTSQDDALHPNLDFTKSTKTEEEVSRYQVSLRSATYFANKLQLEDGATRQIRRIDPVTKDADTLLYFVNFDAGKGWVVLSGDKRTEPILASSTMGDIDLKSMGASAVWFNDLADRIYALKHSDHSDTLSSNYAMWGKIDTLALGLRAKGTNPREKGTAQARILDKNWDNPNRDDSDYDPDYEYVLVDSKVEVLLDTIVGPLLQTRWGQGYPWNQYSPYWQDTGFQCPTGCVAVSGAQLLYYFHFLKNKPRNFYTELQGEGQIHDESGKGTFSYVFNNLSEEAWKKMALNKAGSREGTALVSMLMTYVGLHVEMHYGLEASGAQDSRLVHLYRDFGIGAEYADYDPALVRSSLDKRLPVNVSAYSERTLRYVFPFKEKWFYSGGHSWIIDGYKGKEIRYSYTYERLPKFKRKEDVDETPRAIHYDSGMRDQRMASSSRAHYGYTDVEVKRSYSWKMNFGWDDNDIGGDYNTGESDVWSTSIGGFLYKKKIIHNFTF